MEVKIVFKDYGKGKERLILVNESDGNIAFKSFGKKDSEWEYIFEQYKKQNNGIKAIIRNN